MCNGTQVVLSQLPLTVVIERGRKLRQSFRDRLKLLFGHRWMDFWKSGPLSVYDNVS